MNQTNFDEVLAELATEFEVIDLSHTLQTNIPCWPTQARFGHTLYESYELGDEACHYRIEMSEHTGTHMDAPLHFIRDGKAHYGINEVPLTNVFGRAATIDVSGMDLGGLLEQAHIEQWELKHGALRSGDVCLIRYGWDRHWGLRPNDSRFVRDWPGLSQEAAQYLVEKGIKLVGCDTLSIDAYGSTENSAHYTLLGNEVLIVENLNQLDKLTPFSFFMAFPLPIKNGSGSPVRAVAFVRRSPAQIVQAAPQAVYSAVYKVEDATQLGQQTSK